VPYYTSAQQFGRDTESSTTFVREERLFIPHSKTPNRGLKGPSSKDGLFCSMWVFMFFPCVASYGHALAMTMADFRLSPAIKLFLSIFFCFSSSSVSCHSSAMIFVEVIIVPSLSYLVGEAQS
jgi:hypothetical protein